MSFPHLTPPARSQSGRHPRYSRLQTAAGPASVTALVCAFCLLTLIGTSVVADTVFSDTFSGSHPGSWYIGHDGGAGAYAWAWPNNYAHCYADPSGSEYEYPDELHVYMERRDVSLTAYSTATLSFDYAVDSEARWDYFTVNVKDQSGTWHEMLRVHGPTDPIAWIYHEIDLSEFAGQSGLYIQFRFDSDISVSGFNGAYVDSVVLSAEVGSHTYSVYGIIDSFVGGADADTDGYYETFDFNIGIDADAVPGPASVYGRMICDTTGHSWWSTAPWVVSGTSTDYQYFPFDEKDFAGLISGNTDLDFTVEIWDLSKSTMLDDDSGVFGEPVKADIGLVTPWAVQGIVDSFVGGMDADSDGYYETFDFNIGIDADGEGSVYGKVVCPTTAQDWWSAAPWVVSGTSVDYQYLAFDETDFAGLLTGNTDLDFTVEIWDTSKSIMLDDDTTVTGEPVKAEPAVLTGTLIFNPNPVNVLNDATLTDQSDSDAAVPMAAYEEVTLTHLAPPVAGIYKLTGDYVAMEDIEDPVNVPASSSSIVFQHTRSDDGFEEVMCYYHITHNQEYLQSLGFTDINDRAHRIDAHGVYGAANAYYVGDPIGAGYMSFGDGDGGVDLAEDADVILHEYGHSIQDNSTAGKYFGIGDRGFGDETGAMGEGFGDYWTASCTYTQSIANGYDPAYVGDWAFAPFIRRIDGNKQYPADMDGEVHSDGEIWSACLWQMFAALGKTAADTVVLNSHFLVPDDPTFEDGALAMLSADEAVYGGSHIPQIRAIFAARGILDSDDNYEENDDWTSAYDLSASEHTWLSALNGLGVQADDDWFEILVAPGSERVVVDCQYTHAEGDIDIALYDSAGNTFTPVSGNRTSVGTTGDEQINCVVPVSGTYLVKVYFADAGNSYDLRWQDVAHNAAPTDILLSDSTVLENEPAGTPVGALSTTDPNTGDTFIYTLVSGAGSADIGSFTIAGDQLKTAASFDYESKPSYSVRIRSTDQGTLWYEEPFTISVTDMDERPVLQDIQTLGSSNIVLRWSSITNKEYTVHSTTNLIQGFSVLTGNLIATPPQNSYTDSVHDVQQKYWMISTDE